MDSKIQKFISKEFGHVRGTFLGGQAWLYANDVCKSLELGRVEKALSRLDDDEKLHLESNPPKTYARRKMFMVNESGFFHLYFSCRHLPPNAEEFKRWVVYKVFPALRRSGAALIQKCVYILLLDNFTVKIGMTQDFTRRLRQIEHGSGLGVVKSFHTEYMDGSLAKRLEKCCQEHFADKRLRGEFFNVPFEEAQTELQRLTA